MSKSDDHDHDVIMECIGPDGNVVVAFIGKPADIIEAHSLMIMNAQMPLAVQMTVDRMQGEASS